jgi:hypothetical protein
MFPVDVKLVLRSCLSKLLLKSRDSLAIDYSLYNKLNYITYAAYIVLPIKVASK